MDTMRCPGCDGEGFTVEPAHACGGDERRCTEWCPQPEQVPCCVCEGAGEVPL